MSFKKTQFKNGLTLVSERRRGMNSLSIGAFVRMGSRFETINTSGVSHFLEHMLFKGTTRRSAIDLVRAIEDHGGEFNAFTDREYTCYHVLVLKKEVETALQVLEDILLNSTMVRIEFERERSVILQEILMLNDSPEDMAYDLFFERIYGRHGLGRNILGSRRSIRAMKRADLMRIYGQRYQPKNILLSVSGDIPHATLAKQLGSLATKRRYHSIKTPRSVMEPAPSIRSGRWWIESDTEQCHVVWGVPSFSVDSGDRFTVALLNSYLGGGMSSLLFQEIREKNGLAYNTYSYVYPFLDSGVFTIYAGTRSSQLKKCLSLIEKSVGQMKDRLMTKNELHTAKSGLQGAILLASDDVESRMLSLGRNEMFEGEYCSPEQICRKIDQVTAQDIRRVARALFSAERSILALGPGTTSQKQALSSF